MTPKEATWTIDIDTRRYSGLLFRSLISSWAATSALEAGLSDEEIQLLGRWKSECYRLYIVTHPSRALAVYRRHIQFSAS